MNNTLVSWLARTAFVLGIVGATFSTATAAKPNFADFGGTYKGTWILTAPTLTTTYAASITGDVFTNKSGRKMSVTLSGILAAGSQTVPIQTSLKFNDKRKLTGDALLMGFVGPALTNPARFSGAKNFKFTLTAVPGATLLAQPVTGTVMNYRFKFSKKTLTITGTGVLVQGGSPVPLQITVTLRKRGKN